MDKIVLRTNSESETSQLGTDIAMVLKPGDMIFLSGDLGSGKSVLARSIIRHLADDPELEVPSPTYTLCQVYETSPPVAHFDLYRISGMEELDELGWQDMLETGCLLIEWPEQCFDASPAGTVKIVLSQQGEKDRSIDVTGEGDLYQRIKRSLLIRAFLENSPYKTVTRSHLTGDASARSYELIIADGEEELLLMNAPALPDGPPIKNGLPYSQIAHLAEDVTAFVAIDELLVEKGFAAPQVKAQNLEEGLLLIEHFGDEGIIDKTRVPIPERYMAAIEFLAALHECDFENHVTLRSGETYNIPPYDEQALLIEVDLLLQWYAPWQKKGGLNADKATAFETIWRTLVTRLETCEQSLVLRDYHSPNILWRAGEQGTDRIGVIDFQDALIGPSSYDVASLAQDARVDVSEDLETALVNHYIKMRRLNDAEFNEADFRESYAIMAAQRATKILGIFIRLNERDGKPAYLKHLPRMEAYLKRSLAHPVLAPYKAWLSDVINL